MQKMELCRDSGRWAESRVGEQHAPFKFLSKYSFFQMGELCSAVPSTNEAFLSPGFLVSPGKQSYPSKLGKLCFPATCLPAGRVERDFH